MSAAVSVPWSSILSDMSASLDEMTSLPSADILKLYRPQADAGREFHSFGPVDEGSEPYFGTSASEQDPVPSHSDAPEKRLPNVADWGGTLDLIAGMAGAAGSQRSHLREQTEAQQRALEDLQRELHQAQQRLRASERRVQELQARADSRLQRVQADLNAQVEEARAETEIRVLAVCARNDGLIRATEERGRAAELRARRAEEWLQRVDAAAKSLLLNGHMTRGGWR